MVIGITGGSGAGKTTVSQCFKNLGWFVVDADEVAHNIMTPGSKVLDDVATFFGMEFLNSDGSLNRKKLGNVVFNDAAKLEKLNEITHKHILAEIENQIKNKDKAVIDATVLFESGLNKMCEKTIFVSCPMEIRVKRIMKRDNIDENYAKSRILAQKSDDYYRQLCDFEVVNDDKNDILEQLEEVLNC